MTGERRPMGRPRKDAQQDMSKLATHSSHAVLGSSNQVGVVPIKVEVQASPGGVADIDGHHSTPPTVFIQGQPSGVGISTVLGSLGGNIYMTSSTQGVQSMSPHTSAKHGVVVKQVQLPNEDAQDTVTNSQAVLAAHVQSNAVITGNAERDTEPNHAGPSIVTLVSPAPLPLASVGEPSTIAKQGADQTTPMVKKRGRRKRSPVPPQQDSLPPGKKRRGRPKGSGINSGGPAGRRQSRRSRTLSHSRYANILPRPDLINMGISVQGLHPGGTLTGSANSGSGSGFGLGTSVSDGRVHAAVGAGISSKDVAVAAANCSAALSLGTRKVQ